MAEEVDLSRSTLSLNLNGPQNEDWDRSLIIEADSSSSSFTQQLATATTSRYSVVFPGDRDVTARRTEGENLSEQGSTTARQKRSLSGLLRLHAGKGADVNFSQEEASRVADVLGQWINASSSPYEGEDDFFIHSRDDLALPSKKYSGSVREGRPRGQSDSIGR